MIRSKGPAWLCSWLRLRSAASGGPGEHRQAPLGSQEQERATPCSVKSTLARKCHMSRVRVICRGLKPGLVCSQGGSGEAGGEASTSQQGLAGRALSQPSCTISLSERRLFSCCFEPHNCTRGHPLPFQAAERVTSPAAPLAKSGKKHPTPAAIQFIRMLTHTAHNF